MSDYDKELEEDGIYNLYHVDRDELVLLTWVNETLVTLLYDHLCEKVPDETIVVVTKN